MSKLINRILSLRAPWLILAPQVESKNTREAPDFYSITNLDQIELLPDPQPLILEKADNDLDKNFAGHRSHRSHRSHSSHRSSTSRSYISPSSPSTTSPSPSYQTTPGKASPTPQWRATNEWQKNPNILISHEVIVILKDNSVYKGFVLIFFMHEGEQVVTVQVWYAER